VNYARALVNAVGQMYSLDYSRVAAYGHSLGACMAYRLVCDAADLFTHVAAINGPPPSGTFTCAPARPVKVLHIGGTRDESVRYQGVSNGNWLGAAATAEMFMASNQCPVRSLPASANVVSGTNSSNADRLLDLTLTSGLETAVYEVKGCADGSSVTLWKMMGEYHDLELKPQYRIELAKWLTIVPPSPPSSPSASSGLQSCICGSNPSAYSTYGNAAMCFGANDVTNLEVMFGGLAMADATRAFYQRCSDYDNDGVFRANDLTNMKRYYAGLLSIAAHFSGRR